MNNEDNNTIYVIDGCFATDGDYSIDLNKFDEEYRKYISFDSCLEEYTINVVTDDFYLARDFLEQLIVSFHVIYTHHYVLLDLVERVTEIYNCLMNHEKRVYYSGNYDGTQLAIDKIDKQKLTQDDIDELLGTDEILTKEEKEYLQAVIKPFKDKIISISREEIHESYYHLCVVYDNDMRFPNSWRYHPHDFLIPLFSKGFEGMGIGKAYTLTELKL